MSKGISDVIVKAVIGVVLLLLIFFVVFAVLGTFSAGSGKGILAPWQAITDLVGRIFA